MLLKLLTSHNIVALIYRIGDLVCFAVKVKLCARGSEVLVAHPLHAIAVADLQLLLGPLEAAVLLVVGGRLEVDVNIVGGLRSRRHGCESRHTSTESEQGRTAARGGGGQTKD